MLLGHVLQGKAQESCSSLSGLHSRPGTHPGPPSPQLARTWCALVQPARPRLALPSRALRRPPGSVCFPPGRGAPRRFQRRFQRPNAPIFYRMGDHRGHPAPSAHATVPAPHACPTPLITSTPCATLAHQDGEDTERAGGLCMSPSVRMATFPSGCRSRWPRAHAERSWWG